MFVSGIGIVSAIGQGKAAFLDAMLNQKQNFAKMSRPGRCISNGNSFLGAEVNNLQLCPSLDGRLLRNASLTAKFALAAVHEAWQDANLNDCDSQRIGLIVGGSNLQQRELVLLQEQYANKPRFLSPTYGFRFLDTDIAAICAEQFGIKGFAYSIGGSSASGQLAIIKAVDELLANDHIDVCIAVGGLADLSHWECQGLRALGAMGSDRYSNAPSRACRPFDSERDGFIFGEASAAIVIERNNNVDRQLDKFYARLSGWALNSDAHRNPDPSYSGECRAITDCLARANLSPFQIDYLSPHGSASKIGDETELRALKSTNLNGAMINTTKSLTGHCLSAAGTVEVVATLLQMQAEKVHASLNLSSPIDLDFNWVKNKALDHKINHALTLSMGFGGINTALAISKV